MFSLISGFLNWYFAKPTFKLLIVGEEKSGKSVWYSFNNRPTLSNSNTSFFVDSITLDLFSGVRCVKRSLIKLEPKLEVIMMIVFLKFTVRPLLSVKRPSSSTWSSMLNTSGCAFSISSNNTTEYGLRRTASVS